MRSRYGTKSKIALLVSLFLMPLFSLTFAQEQLTITTYYPSPFGNFIEMRTNRFIVASTRAMPITDGTLSWGEGKGALSPDQGASIELGGGGVGTTPYIDFADLPGEDFDVRIIRPSDTTLRVQVNMGLYIRNQNNTAMRDLFLRCINYYWATGAGTICSTNLDVIN